MNHFIDDTIQILHNDLTQARGMSLSAIMANEMYFLPRFLNHYRALGIERFFLLDDNSTDGTREYAMAQPDVMLVTSDHSYGAQLPLENSTQTKRAMLAWRTTLPAKYAPDEWHVHVDLDEFIALPKSMRLPDLVKELDTYDLVWSSMVDLYPTNWHDIDGDATHPIDVINWHFDARRLYSLHLFKSKPSLEYSGARARLTYEFAPERLPSESLGTQLKRTLRRNPYPQVNNNLKPTLIKWQDRLARRSSHYVANGRFPKMMLPLLHYKFAPNFASKLRFAFERRAHDGDAHDYKLLELIYRRMVEKDASFIGPDSMTFQGYDDLENAGIAYGVQ